MANRVPTLLATAVAAACSLSAHASGPTQADYAKVVLYSNVTIAQDSASQWGIWEELEPTAAGPQTPLPLIAGTVDPYRPVGNVTPTTLITPVTPTDPGSVGKLVGFGVIYPSAPAFEQAAALGGNAPERQGFKLETDGTTWMPAVLTVSTVGVRDAVPAFDNFGPMTLTGGNTHQRDFSSDSTFEYGSLITDQGSVAAQLPGAPAELGLFNGELTRYVNGMSENTRPSVQVYGVWGVSTPENDIAALTRNNVSATYSGYMLDEGNVRSGTIVMNVKFGDSSFTATVNGGRDQPGVTVQSTASGQPQLQGAVGFYMSGRLDKGNWQATEFSADDLKRNPKNLRPVEITGAASGAFIGPQAAAVIGSVDITKSNARTDPASNAPIYEAGRFVSGLVAVKQSPK